MRFRLAALVALVPLAACSTINEAVKGPELTPVGYPASLAPQSQVILASARDGIPQAASANSLWRSGARAFFIDQRAGKVGAA